MRIIVLGAGTAGAIAAGIIKKRRPDIEVLQIHSEQVGIIGVGESVTPYLNHAFQELGMVEKDWMTATGSMYKLGNKFEGWTDEDHYFAFTYNKPIDKLINNKPIDWNDIKSVNETDIRLTDVWCDLYNQGMVNNFSASFNDLHNSLVNNTFDFKSLDRSCLNYSYHINAEKLAPYIRKNINSKLGVIEIEGKVVKVNTNDNGVHSVEMENGEVYTSDYWFDCSGFNRLLINELDDSFHTYDYCKANSAVVMPIEYTSQDQLTNHTRTIWLEQGWQFKIGLTERIGTGIIYSDEYFSDEEIKQLLLEKENHKNIRPPKILKWTPGRMVNPAIDNVFSIGMAAGFCEPMEANALYITMATIKRALHSINQDENRNTFNKVINHTLDDTALFIAAHYTLCEKGNNAYWSDMRKIGVEQNHKQLLLEKYNDVKNNMESAVNHYTMYPDYMWMELASAWCKDISTWSKNTDPKLQQQVLEYFKKSKSSTTNQYPEEMRKFHNV